MPTDAELMKQMAEALKAIARQAKLAKPSSLMVPLIEDAEDALAAYRAQQSPTEEEAVSNEIDVAINKAFARGDLTYKTSPGVAFGEGWMAHSVKASLKVAALEARVRELEGYESRAKEAESALYCIVIHGYTPGEKDGMTCRCSFETAETVRRLYRRAGFPIPAALTTPTAAGEAADAGMRGAVKKALEMYAPMVVIGNQDELEKAASNVLDCLRFEAALATQPPAGLPNR